MSKSSRYSLPLMTSAFCLLRQAERSIDNALLLANWQQLEHALSSMQSLRSYYDEERRAEIVGVTAHLESVSQIDPQDWDEARNQYRLRLRKNESTLNYALAWLRSRIFGDGLFSNIEVAFVIACLKASLGIATGERTVTSQYLIELRMDCSLAQGIISVHCLGLPKISTDIEHLNQNLDKRHYTVNEVLSAIH